MLRTVSAILFRKATGSITSAWSPQPRIQLSKSGAMPTCMVNSIPAWPSERICCDLCHCRSETSRAATASKRIRTRSVFPVSNAAKLPENTSGNGKVRRPFERNLQLRYAVDACQSERSESLSILVARDQVPLVINASEVVGRHATALGLPGAKREDSQTPPVRLSSRRPSATSKTLIWP